MEVTAYIAIGANLGDRQRTIDLAIRAIGQLDRTRVVQVSTIIETAPVGPQAQGDYLNAVMCVTTELGARELLTALLKIESTHGRDRATEERWGARTLDLDLLIYSDHIIDEPTLHVPHPRMHERPFVLVPLCEIAPELKIPGYTETPRAMLRALPCD